MRKKQQQPPKIGANPSTTSHPKNSFTCENRTGSARLPSSAAESWPFARAPVETGPPAPHRYFPHGNEPAAAGRAPSRPPGVYVNAQRAKHLGLPSWRIRVVRGAESLGVNVRPQTRPCTVTFRKTRFPLLKFVASFSYAYLSNGRSLRMIFFLMLAGVTGLLF